MLTVEHLLQEVGLKLCSGEAAADTPVRWVHCTELLDPTPWLLGGELLLTTGMGLEDPERQRAFVARLVEHRIAGLGLGLGFTHPALPQALLAAARARALPVFAVPYELPFIAICERAFSHLVSEQYEALRRSTAIQGRLERIVLDERGLDAVVRVVADSIGGAAGVFDRHGETIAWHSPRRTLPDAERAALSQAVVRSAAQEKVEPVLQGRALVLPVLGREQAWLAAVGEGSPFGEFERLILQQAVTVVALELMRLRVARDTERRLAGDVLAEALTGRLHPEELAARLRPFGLGDELAVLAFATRDPVAGEPLLAAALERAGVRVLVAVRGPLLCAVVDAAGRDPIEIARAVRPKLSAALGDVRAAASRAGAAHWLRRSFHEARCALEAVRFANGDAPEVASHRDLGSFQLLLSLQDDEALRTYCDSVLAAVEEGDAGYADELLRSLDAFLEHNGHWERAASQVFCHRHTLRYRIRRIEQLTGRNLSSPRDRIEFWLALRGRELAL
jgi:PucR family transcriptional regulator, purine catabolism regulatory protein